MQVDLHNHTTRCNHASGTMEEYLERAVERGIDVYGFSDHAPMAFDPAYRMALEERIGYEAEIRELARRFRGKIDVLSGYEVDYLPGYMEKEILEAEVDYLIGSVHFLDGWGFDNPEFIGEYDNRDIDEVWKLYFQRIGEMAQTGLFQIVGHLDLIKVFGFFPKGDMAPAIRTTLEAIKESGMAVEISSAGWRKKVGECYPAPSILETIRKMEIPITFGSDAHAPEQVGWKLGESMALARNLGFEECAIFRRKERELVKF